MDLDSARALKQEIQERALTRSLLTRSSLPADAVSRSALPVVEPPPPIAIGIEGRDGEYRLAVRIRETTPGLQSNLDRIARIAQGEVSVKVVGPLVKQQIPLRSRTRPLRIGSSVGHPDITAGTLGCFVTAGGDDRAILSNNHVLADENRASLGDEILQPGPRDAGQPPGDRIATLSNFVPLTSIGKNSVDAAVANLIEGIQGDFQALPGLGPLNGVRTSPLEGEEIVFKIGRTTGLTRGRVSAFEVDDVWVQYDMGTIGFDNQIEIASLGSSPFSLGGDSGSLIVDEDLRAVALLFAGNDVDVTYANPIQEVLQILGVQIVE